MNNSFVVQTELIFKYSIQIEITFAGSGRQYLAKSVLQDSACRPHSLVEKRAGGVTQRMPSAGRTPEQGVQNTAMRRIVALAARQSTVVIRLKGRDWRGMS
jgi:hypothetical protein